MLLNAVVRYIQDIQDKFKIPSGCLPGPAQARLARPRAWAGLGLGQDNGRLVFRIYLGYLGYIWISGLRLSRASLSNEVLLQVMQFEGQRKRFKLKQNDGIWAGTSLVIDELFEGCLFLRCLFVLGVESSFYVSLCNVFCR